MTHHIKKFKIIIICLMMLSFSGCWNNRNLTDLGIIVGMGLEKVENNEIEITVQLIEPCSEEGSKQVGKDKTWRSLSARGDTVFEANRNLLTKVNKKLNYSNVQLMVIGEKLATNGIDDVLDFFQRVHEVDKRETVLISKGINPKELLNVDAEQASVSALEIVQTIKNTDRLASIRKISMYDLILDIVGENNSVVGMVKATERGPVLKMSDLDFTGGAVFNKDKLVGWLTSNEINGFSIIDNKFKNPSLNVVNSLNMDKRVTIEITKCVAKKDMLFNDDKPTLYVEVYAQGKMVEQHGKGNLTETEHIRDLEKEVSGQIEKIVNRTIKNAQENLQVDIFGFNKIAHSKNLSYWNGVKNEWDKEFSNLHVEVRVKYKNKDMGFIKEHR